MRPVVDGVAEFGTYAGACETTSLADVPVGRLRRLLQEKGWQWFCASDERLAVGGAIVDAGLANTVFGWVHDRTRGRLLVDESRILPPTTVRRADRPQARPRVAASFRDVSLVCNDGGGGLAVAGTLGLLGVDLSFERRSGGPVTAVCPVGDGRHPGVNVTQKEACLSVSGRVDWAGGTHRFTAADGMLDFSHGLLERDTRWRWAIGSGTTDDGTPVGFNAVAGFNDGLENVVWVDGQRRAVGDATLTFDADDPQARWAVDTDDGVVDVRLEPETVRTEDRNLGVARSTYTQPVGTWRGTVAGRSVELVGVAENHRAKW
jgi:hypothetical protein